jgi:phospholipase C
MNRRIADIALLLVLSSSVQAAAEKKETATPIKHLVVIFQENVSFDHYFGTYPNALNKPGEPSFNPLPGTPTVNGLSETLLTKNPNAAQPRRLDRAHAATCDQDHSYGAEQKAAHGGLMDKFVESTGDSDEGCDPKIVLDYFDGNTVTALWNYAQHFSMSDNFYDTIFGPSTPGALNLVSGQTHGVVPANLVFQGDTLTARGTIIADPDPQFDDCSAGPTVHMTGTNIGDRLNAAGVTWGWFEGGFRATARTKKDQAVCGTSHTGGDGKPHNDYIPHHEPFQYYKSTANPGHLPPSAPAKIGETDRANHQYDLADFWLAAEGGAMPSVSFLKAPAYQDGHAGYSDPVTEQTFLVETINRLQGLPSWKDMAIVITYDDSDGWYDHVMPPVVNQSHISGVDALTGGSCGTAAPGAYLGRCGYGPRLPLLIISPFAKTNFVDHTITDQTSILRLIEDNWSTGRIGDQSFDEKAAPLLQMFEFERAAPAARLKLDPETGRP